MTEADKKLREIFRTMDGDRFTRIRDAYYKAVEGLQSLAEELESASDERYEGVDSVLLSEHINACMAIAAMKNSRLGRIL